MTELERALVALGRELDLPPEPDLGSRAPSQIGRIRVGFDLELANTVDRWHVGHVDHITLDAHAVERNLVAVLTGAPCDHRALVVRESRVVERA